MRERQIKSERERAGGDDTRSERGKARDTTICIGYTGRWKF